MIIVNWGVDSLNEVVTLTMWDLNHPLAGIHGVLNEESLRELLFQGGLALSELEELKRNNLQENEQIAAQLLKTMGIEVEQKGAA